jgi:CheY-like chemotaxis protein
MPVLDGFEVLRRLRGDPRLREIPVFVLTASLEEAMDRYPSLLAGVKAFQKPYVHGVVIEAIQAVLAAPIQGAAA